MASYFAAANTGKGFVGYFDRIFGDVSRLYVIIGGPGTGKSRLLRELASEAEKKGHACEWFYCSSDPSSLDGVLIEDLDCAMIDGTAPHTWEMKCPGAIEQVVDLGQFWDARKLAAVTEEAQRLTALKRSDYASAYRLLSAVCELEGEIDRLGREAVLFDKLDRTVERLSRKWSSNGTGIEDLRISTDVSSKGRITLDIPGSDAPKRVAVTGPRFAVREILGALYQKAVSYDSDRTVSFEVPDTDHIETLYLRSEKTMFTSLAFDDPTDILNAWRFVDRDILKKHRSRIRFYERCRDSLYDAALERMTSAGVHHADLEELYGGAMDFAAKESYCKGMIGEILRGK